jgi:CubicO group peptidase (beta-lactamase class C family)
MRVRLLSAFAIAVSVTAAMRGVQPRDLGLEQAAVQTAAPSISADVDRIFAKWNTSTTPGCAVGAAVDGRPTIAKGYGMADLEHDVRITPDSIFEAGSVSKQFTAAAILLLARDGKLSIDDPVRTYLPELPDYGVPLTIRHMLNHTSGLRDWGSVEGIAGWPRGTRTYTHAHVLEIVSHQKSLNFTPGTRWSYSNTGFNLAAMIVSRVSGKPFADFTRERLFAPLGMTHTSWRDDFTRILKNRALAYADRNGDFHLAMPFENVYGNGGLLTTVGDLLTWNQNFTSPTVGDAAFVAMQQQPGKFNDGRPHTYAFGLMIGRENGIRIVEHSGSTGGYSAHLLRLPDQKISVAVLCNATTARATRYAHEVADLYLPSHASTLRPDAQPAPPPDGMLYRSVDNGTVLSGVPRDMKATVDGTRVRLVGGDGIEHLFELVPHANPTVAQLRDLAGVYTSDEAETTLTVALDGEALVITRRPDTVVKLAPLYADAFRAAQLGTVIFRRDAGGRVTALSVVEDRVWDLRFTRQPARASTSERARR